MWTIHEEAEHLAKRFAAGQNREEFARDFGIPGKGAMIYQHITDRKPISLEAAVGYAKGFQCSLADISPRWAAVIESVTNHTVYIAKNETDIAEVARLMRVMGEDSRRHLLKMARVLAEDQEIVRTANGAQ